MTLIPTITAVPIAAYAARIRSGPPADASGK
jgi:hypothetical protein